MANASGTAEVGLLNLMKHKMSRGTFNEGHEPSKSAEAEGPCPESEETKAESKENEESESEIVETQGSLKRHFEFDVPIWKHGQTCAFRDNRSACKNCITKVSFM